MIKVGPNMKSLRNKAKMTQKQLAEKLNVVDSTISHWEKGDRKISPDDLTRLADIFNVSVDDLLNVDIDQKKRASSVQKIVSTRTFKNEIKAKCLLFKLIVAGAFFGTFWLIEPGNSVYMILLFVVASSFIVYDILSIFRAKKTIRLYTVDKHEEIVFSKQGKPANTLWHYVTTTTKYVFFLILCVFIYSLFFSVLSSIGNESYLPYVFSVFMIVFAALVIIGGVFDVIKWSPKTHIKQERFTYDSELIVHKLRNVLCQLGYAYIYLATFIYRESLDSQLVWIFLAFAPIIVIFSHGLYVQKLHDLSAYDFFV